MKYGVGVIVFLLGLSTVGERAAEADKLCTRVPLQAMHIASGVDVGGGEDTDANGHGLSLAARLAQLHEPPLSGKLDLDPPSLTLRYEPNRPVWPLNKAEPIVEVILDADPLPTLDPVQVGVNHARAQRGVGVEQVESGGANLLIPAQCS